MSARRGIPFVVSAPSGTGKTTVCRAVVARDPDIEFSVSHTTRPPRTGERDGVHYHFVSDRHFRRLAAEGAFVEHAIYAGHRYGTSWESLERPLDRGRDLLLEVEVQGARQIRQRLHDARFVFLLPPSLEELARRLRDRGTDRAEVVRERLTLVRSELAAVHEFDYAVVNEQLENAIAAVLEIVAAERCGERTLVERRYGRSQTLARSGAVLGLRP